MTTINIRNPMIPPTWALIERQLIQAQSDACEAFYDKYFDERGWLRCVPRWSASDGADDAAENFNDWTLLYALGGSPVVLDRYLRAWEGHLAQYTAARTVECEVALDGMYYREFPVMFDWGHNGEGFGAFWLQGLATPYDTRFHERTKRFASFYITDDPAEGAPVEPNWDPQHRIIRSMFSGSRGPLLRKATVHDWAGDPIELEGRFVPGHGERDWEHFVKHFKDYTDVAGDHPLNLATTVAATNAFLIDGESKYRDWVLDYCDAWVERTAANDGVIPSNIGLDGTIGGETGGRWWGGTYGWGFTIDQYRYGESGRRHQKLFSQRYPRAYGNALLLSGDFHFIDSWRGVLEAVNSNTREVDGQICYPRMYGTEEGEPGWYAWQPIPFDDGAADIYYWSMRESDFLRVGDDPWFSYLHGDNSDFPEQVLMEALTKVREQMAQVAADLTPADSRMSDDPNGLNPGNVSVLNRLTMGGLPTDALGAPLHCRLRHFDPDGRRPGLPPDVAALVDHMDDTSVSVTLVNLDMVRPRTLLMQAGAHAEHQFTSAAGDQGGDRTSASAVDGDTLRVTLAPGAGGRLTLGQKRFYNTPSYTYPWDR